MTQYQRRMAADYASGQAAARRHSIVENGATAEYMAAYIRELQREHRAERKARQHEQNRAKAKARRKALQVIFAAAINAKEV